MRSGFLFGKGVSFVRKGLEFPSKGIEISFGGNFSHAQEKFSP